MRIKYCLMFAAILFLIGNPLILKAQEPTTIRVPRLSAVVDPQEKYIYELLLLVLKNCGTEYQLIPSESQMQQARAIREISLPSGGIDLLWTMSTDERESQMIAIKIPIEKGLIGWRIPLVKKGNSQLLASVKNLHDLAVFTAGQEYDWPDTTIIKANKLAVITSSSYEPLFNMLQAGRFDYFPRSMMEIWNEFSAHPHHDLYIDEHIILHYPASFYFFVSFRRPKLAEHVRLGFEAIIKDGSFEKLFQKYNASLILKSDIKHRTIIELENPYFHMDKLDNGRPELWFSP